MAENSNAEMVSLWNSEVASSWATHPDRYDGMLAPLGWLALDAAHLRPGERILDVGCGAGQLSLEAAARVSPGGSVVGADLSIPLLELARERAERARVASATFVEADAQVHRFDVPFDVVISRFGVMFFADPVAAFANLHAATVEGGRLAFVCWQPAPANEWVVAALNAFRPHVDLPAPPPPGAPGPFAFGDPDHIKGVLEAAGWADVEIGGVMTTVAVGGATTVDEAVEFYLEDNFGRMLLASASPEQRAAATRSLEEALAPHVSGGHVGLGAAVWVVTADRPG